MRAPGRCHRRGHDLEVLGAVRVGQDDQAVAVMLDVVLQLRRARLDEARRRADAVGAVEEPDFGGLVVARFDQHEGVGLRDAELHEEAGILLLVDRPRPASARVPRRWRLTRTGR